MAKRVPYLDGLRALAILLVVLFHAIQFHPTLGAHREWFWPFVLSQGHGVQLFFVLSGFCLAFPTLARLKEEGIVDFDLARFTARRIVRIVPSYWIAIVALIAMYVVLVHFHVRPGGSMPDRLNAVKIVEQALLFNLRPEWMNGSFWTLPIEVHWYFVCPILLWVWTRSPRAFVAILVLCWFAAATTRFQAPDVKYLPAFMLGIVAADWRVNGSNALSKYAPLTLVVFAIVGTAQELLQLPLAFHCWQLAMFALVVAAGESPALGRLFSARILAPLAAASYSIYLVHAPVLGTIEVYLPLRVQPGEALTIACACGILAGLLFSQIAEKPFRYGPLRSALLKRLDGSLPNVFRALGVQPQLRIGAAHVIAIHALKNEASFSVPKKRLTPS